jgi:hypothetical protein
MDKEIIKKGIAEAEKEAQEKEIAKVKQIVKLHLERIDDLKERENKARDERKLLEKDLTDLKSGRLDKIEERQANDDVSKIKSIIIVHRIEKEYVPFYPWASPWQIVINQPYMPIIPTCTIGQSSASYTVSSSTPGYSYISMNNSFDEDSQQLTVSGKFLQNFAGGFYEVNGKQINL